MIGTGAVVVLAETENLLVVAGAVLVALGVYGLARRRAPRGSGRPSEIAWPRSGRRSTAAGRDP